MRIVSARQLARMNSQHDDFALIDVLPHDSFEHEHLPGARSVPLDDGADFAERVESLVGGKHRSVVVYCASASCDASTRAARALERAGFSDVADFEGGLAGWKEAGLPLEGHMERNEASVSRRSGDRST